MAIFSDAASSSAATVAVGRGSRAAVDNRGATDHRPVPTRQPRGLRAQGGPPRSPFARGARSTRASPPPPSLDRRCVAVLAVQLLVTAASALTFAGRPELVRAFATTPLRPLRARVRGGRLAPDLSGSRLLPPGRVERRRPAHALHRLRGAPRRRLLLAVPRVGVALVLLQTCAAVTGLTACVLPPASPSRARARAPSASRPRAARPPR